MRDVSLLLGAAAAASLGAAALYVLNNSESAEQASSSGIFSNLGLFTASAERSESTGVTADANQKQTACSPSVPASASTASHNGAGKPRGDASQTNTGASDALLEAHQGAAGAHSSAIALHVQPSVSVTAESKDGSAQDNNTLRTPHVQQYSCDTADRDKVVQHADHAAQQAQECTSSAVQQYADTLMPSQQTEQVQTQHEGLLQDHRGQQPTEQLSRQQHQQQHSHAQLQMQGQDSVMQYQAEGPQPQQLHQPGYIQQPQEQLDKQEQQQEGQQQPVQQDRLQDAQLQPLQLLQDQRHDLQQQQQPARQQSLRAVPEHQVPEQAQVQEQPEQSHLTQELEEARHLEYAELHAAQLQESQQAEVQDTVQQSQQQQLCMATSAAAQATPQHSKQHPTIATGPPSERDKAIMYRLSIDKSAWHNNSSSIAAADQQAATNVQLSPRLSESVAAELAAAGSAGGASSVIAAFERTLSRQISGQPSGSGSSSPKSSTTSPRGSGGGVRQRQVFNTARNQPSVDTTVSIAAVARSLAVQYADIGEQKGAQNEKAVQSLSALCGDLCKQHCSKLQDGAGELGETTALDIGCGTGGSCFHLALSFSHVLGIDSDAMHVVAAKELKDKGQLGYRPVTEQPLVDGHAAADSVAVEHKQLQDGTCIARVAQDCDRDKVRFWCYPLPDLPPKLQPVDAVLVEDVEGRLESGLSRVCQQLPALLNPGGVCVVVLPGNSGTNTCDTCHSAVGGGQSQALENGLGFVQETATGCNGASISSVRHWLEQHGLQFVREQLVRYPVVGAPGLQTAVAGVWLQPK